jgi:alcohol dehydrogenase class IV
MPTVLETTRHEWQEGHRRLQAAAGDRARYAQMLEEVDIVLQELRRRVGQTFTLDELAAAYGDADRWAQEALAERDPYPGWPTRLATVQDAAFHLYSRGALDYRP